MGNDKADAPPVGTVTTPKSPTPFINEGLARTLTRVTQTVMSETFAITARAKPVVVSDEALPTADVSGFIPIIQDTTSGMLVFLFPRQTVDRLTLKIYRTLPSEPEKAAASTVGEICNMVFGVMKMELNSGQNGGQQTSAIKMALPNVVVGHDHRVSQVSSGRKFIVSFESELGPFQMAVATANEGSNDQTDNQSNGSSR